MRDSRAEPVRRKRAGPLRYLALLALLGAGAAAAGVLYLQSQGVTPRALAPYVAKRSAGHNPAIVGTGQWMAATLTRLDRGVLEPYALPPLKVGAQSTASAAAGAGVPRLVASADEVRQAVAGAQPGDVITLLPGTYLFGGSSVAAKRPGTEAQPIVVRAARAGTVRLEFQLAEGFVVSAPYWRFENLSIQGICKQHAWCEHAFHVVGGAHHFAAVNNTIVDFNAHFKINGSGRQFPDHGLIEGNTLTNSEPRQTNNPVTPIDLVAASDWTIRANLITDFIKRDGDRISYGAFAKGAGARTLFERNVVLCEQRLQGQPGQRVGLSFGGGGSGKPYCRDGKCITEQDQGVMRANLIAACSDVGIYVNSGSGSRILHNTLIDTAGVQVRFPESSAEVEGNVIDGAVHSRNGGQVRAADNLDSPIAWLYAGLHPQRGLFTAPQRFDFAWKDAP
jgi:hypothetical protein